MSLLRNREKRQWQPEPFVPPFPGTNMFGAALPNITNSMQSSTVFACIRVLAGTVSMMPLQAYTVRNDQRVPIPMPKLFAQPAAGTNTPEWVYMLMASLALKGNAYGRIVQRDVNLYPTQIELLNPDDVDVRRDPATGVVTFSVKGNVIPAQDLYHPMAYRMPGYPVGLSPIQYGAVMINRDKAIQAFSLGYFQDAPHPASVLTSDQPVNAEHAKTIKARLLAAVNGREPLILGAGLKFTPLSVSPNESQFLETSKYGSSEICRFFGVPPQKIAAADVGSSMTYSSVEADGLDFLASTIQWWLTILEASFATLLPGNQHVRFDTSVLLRTDMETLLKSTAIGIASKQMTPDEARALRDEPPLTEAQKTLLDLVPMDVGPTGTPKLLPGVNKIAAATDPNLAAETEGAS